MKPVIEVKDLSKSYNISHELKPEYSTIKDSFSNFLQRPFHGMSSEAKETFWALNDVSFSVNPGEVFGVIGRNGSGKSTLLKILSRIVQPTKGEVTMHGRVASLLEVGTGFHPELTGRENIYFNGSMLGMSRREIDRKFNDIVDFAETEKFLDTPVKFYSSGMYVRLAFSVAAHLEPDILILDEVLAVGDAAFQKKSLNKILETMNQNRTVLFVSHSMGAVRQLCSRGILLKDGKVVVAGDVETIIDGYTSLIEEESPDAPIRAKWQNNGSVRNDYFVPAKMHVVDDSGTVINGKVRNDKDYWLCIEGELKTTSEIFNIGYVVRSQETKNNLYLSMSTDAPQRQWPKLHKGYVTFRTKIPGHLLNSGLYRIQLVASLHNKSWIMDPETKTPSIEVSVEDDGLSDSPYWKHARAGLLAPVCVWEIE